MKLVTRPRAALATVFALAASALVIAPIASAAPAVPTADILNADYSTGAPTDLAQGLAVKTWGAPSYANDSTLGQTVASFNGSSDAYAYTFSQQWSKLTTGLTYGCVFKWNGTSIPTTGQSAICSDAQSGGADMQIDSGQLAFSVNVGGTYIYAHAPIGVGTWYDAVATWNGSTINLYVNGQLAQSVAASGALHAPVSDGQNFVVGGDADSGNGIQTPSPVSVASAQVWSSALTAAQAQARAQQLGLFAPSAPVPAADILDADYTSGSAADTAQGLALTAAGGPAIDADPQLGSSVASFNGSSQAYMYDFSGQWSKLTAASGISVECRFKWNGDFPSSGQKAICSNAQSGGMDLQYDATGTNCTNPTGQLTFSINVSGYKYACTPIQRGQWYDAIATWDKSTVKLYLNGVLTGSLAASGSVTAPSASAQHFTIGADSNGTAPSATAGYETPSPVSVSTAKVWGSALTAAQVANESIGYAVAVADAPHGTAASSASSALAGETVTLTPTTDAGYHAAGWSVLPATTKVATDGTFTMPHAPVDITPRFAANSYTIHFDPNGGTGTMADQTVSYDTSTALEANAFRNDSSDLVGWATTPGGDPVYTDGQEISNLTATQGATVTLYAVWLPADAHLITLGATSHGAVTAPRYATAGETVQLTATPDTGYHLAQWKVTSPSDGSVVVASDGTFTMPAQQIAITPGFAANDYTVHFNGNGADEGTMPDGAFVYDTAAALPTPAFLRDGFVFAGWATSADGSVAYANGASVTNLTADENGTVTLYAVWQKPQATAGSWSSLQDGFVTDTFKLPAVPSSGTVSQALVGLWNGKAPTAFTTTSGDGWLSVSADGVVTGTAPAAAPQDAATIVVSATNGTTTSQIRIEVPVDAPGIAPQTKTASWNAWNAGANVTDAVGKNLAVIAAQGIDVIGFQDGGAIMAQKVGAALGWNVRASGDLGIVSAYPFTNDPVVSSSASAPALATTVDVDDQPVRVWDAFLDESSSATRDAQATAIAAEVKPDASGSTPVVLLGDLASSAEAGALTDAGLTDSFREANPDAAAAPGNTLLFANPSDRVDFVLYAGDTLLKVVSSNTVTVGWPSATNPAGNSWASDHAAVVSTFRVGDGEPATAPTLPVVTLANDTIAYQVGHGPTDASALLADAGAASDTPDATLTADLGSVDFSTPGWYTVLVTATTADGVRSDPAALTVRVAPVPGLALGSTTATFGLGDAIDEPGVLAQLEPVLDVEGATNVGLDGVNAKLVGDYPVTVTATDEWGFTVTQQATIRITDAAPHYSVAFDANGGDGSMASFTTGLSDQLTLPTTAFTRTGYSFGGWATSADGAAAYADAAVVAPLTTDADSTVTLYAVWTPISYSISYQLNGGTATGSNPTSYTVESEAITLSNPTRAGFRFDGWTGPGYATPSTNVTIPAGTTGDLSFAANWTGVSPVLAFQTPGAGATVAGTVPVAVTLSGEELQAYNLRIDSAGLQYVWQPKAGTQTFQLDTTTLSNGVHTLLATATDARGGKSTITVKITVANPTAWNAKTMYNTGDTVSYQGAVYQAAWYTQGEKPGANPTGAWQQRGEPTVTPQGTAQAWTASWIYTGGETVAYDGKLWKAAWYTRDAAPGDPTGAWEQIGAPVTTGTGTVAAWTASWIYNGGETVAYQGRLYAAQWYTRNQAPGAANGPWKDLGTYTEAQ
ncbi:MAG TPA: InlB B-repeat-containing protein [Gryllotalpicola sp.]